MKVMINIKADKEVKENAQKVASELGMPLSTVINVFLKDFVRSRSIAFSAIPKMTPYLENILGVIDSDIKNNRNMSSSFSTAKKANAYLDTL